MGWKVLANEKKKTREFVIDRINVGHSALEGIRLVKHTIYDRKESNTRGDVRFRDKIYV